MLVFRGADVFPGDGPCFRTDVGVADGKIVAICEALKLERMQSHPGGRRFEPASSIARLGLSPSG